MAVIEVKGNVASLIQNLDQIRIQLDETGIVWSFLDVCLTHERICQCGCHKPNGTEGLAFKKNKLISFPFRDQ